MREGSLEEIRAITKENKPVILWTIQSVESWKEFRRTGVFLADGRRVYHGFRLAYRWMMDQMKRRIPDYAGRYPIWAWYFPRPNLRQKGFLPSGSRSVLIQFRSMPNQTLLSDFDAWHQVLNRNYLSLSVAEDRFWGKKLKEYPRSEIQRKIQFSWEKIFDLNAINNSLVWGPATHIQAVVEKIKLNEVISTREFVAR